MVATNLEIIQGPAALLDMFPWLARVAPSALLDRWMKVDVLYANLADFHKFVMVRFYPFRFFTCCHRACFFCFVFFSSLSLFC